MHRTSDVDPDPRTQMNADPTESGSTSLHRTKYVLTLSLQFIHNFQLFFKEITFLLGTRITAITPATTMTDMDTGSTIPRVKAFLAAKLFL